MAFDYSRCVRHVGYIIASGAEIVCSVVVLNYHHTSQKQPLSPRTKHLIFGVLRRFVGVHLGKSPISEDKVVNEEETDSQHVEEDKNDGNWVDVGRVFYF